MKKEVVFTLLVGLLLALTTPGTGNDEADVAYPEVSRITAEELKHLMETKGEYVLVDTRDSYSYDYGHIKGAVNIHYNPTGDPVAREMMLSALPMDKMIIVYCSCDNDKNSAILALELWDLGYDRDKIKVLSKGSLRWEELGYPLTTTEK